MSELFALLLGYAAGYLWATKKDTLTDIINRFTK